MAASIKIPNVSHALRTLHAANVLKACQRQTVVDITRGHPRPKRLKILNNNSMLRS